jgi:hypothetical protein
VLEAQLLEDRILTPRGVFLLGGALKLAYGALLALVFFLLLM